jgi:capsular polysaccharide biosynthesis protein
MFPITVNLSRMRNRLHRWHGKRVSLMDVAARSWMISPAHLKFVRAPVISEQSLARLTAICDHRDIADERHRLTATKVQQGECRAYELRQAVLTNDCLYCGAYVGRHGKDIGSTVYPVGDAAGPHMAQASLACTYPGSNYFGTFIKDQLPLVLLAQQHGNPVQFSHKPYGHAASYLQLLEMSEPRTVISTKVDKLTVFDDYAQSTHKMARFESLRAITRSVLAQSTHSEPAVVYIKRPNDGAARGISNDAQLITELAAAGVAIIDPAGLSALEIASLIIGARIVISVEGSHLAHALLSMADHGSLIVLQPPDRFSMAYKDFTDAHDMSFAAIVGSPTTSPCIFNIDISEVLHTIDIMDHLSA